VKRFLKGPWLWIIIAVVGVIAVLQLATGGAGGDQIPTGQMVKYIDQGKVQDITFVDGDQVIQATLDKGTRSGGDKVTAHWVDGQQQSILAKAQAQYDAGSIEKLNSTVARPGIISTLLSYLLAPVLIVVLFLFLMNQVQGGGGRGVMQFAKSKAKLISKDMPKTTFSDVAGCDEAIEELQEIKEFLQEPAKFQAVGAKIPKGVLLYGQPGTGKTLLARAVAGEAGVPFYSISGSDFVEMFVGVGASRVRDLFEPDD
jgi:cell division protease FtsH